jgi:hypothetical protein
MLPKLTPAERWIVHGVISRAVARGEEERWIRRELKSVGVLITHCDAEEYLEVWEQDVVKDARIANSKPY